MGAAGKYLHLVHENPNQQLLEPVCTPTLNCQAPLHLFTLHVLPVYWANKLEAVISTHQNPTCLPGPGCHLTFLSRLPRYSAHREHAIL